MMTTIFMVVTFVFMIFLLLMPGVLLAKRMVEGISGRTMTACEWILALIPGFNLTIPRKALYNSATSVWIVYSLFTVNMIFRFISLAEFIPLVVSMVSLVLTWILLVVTWVFTGFILSDMAECVGLGISVKIMSFLVPPLAEFFIAKQCPILSEEDE